MKRRTMAIICVVLGITVIAAATLLSYGHFGKKPQNQILSSSTDRFMEPAENAVKQENTSAVYDKAIPVENNTVLYDLKLSLHQNDKKQVFLKLEYYNNGNDVLKEFDEAQIPELKGITINSSEAARENKGRRITKAYLDIKNSKLFMSIEGESDSSGTVTSIYSYSLDNLTIKRLYTDKGEFTPVNFSKDGSYMAFSVKNNSGISMLSVIKCSTEDFTVRDNKNSKQQAIGNPEKPENANYGFVSWFANTVVKLNKITGEAKSEALYDIAKDVFLNPDGTLPASAGGQTIKDTESIIALKSFYQSLSTGKYDKAYELMDEVFKLNAFKQFGEVIIKKSEVALSDFTTYGAFFQSGRLSSILKEDINGNTSYIYFYQVVSFEQGDQQQALKATLKKTPKGWRVSALDEGNVNEAPFKQ